MLSVAKLTPGQESYYERSVAAGLKHRPVRETVRDTLAWFKALPADRQAAAKWVISREKEREILAAARPR